MKMDRDIIRRFANTIHEALSTNNAGAVDRYHLFQSLVETHEMIKHLRRMNISHLENFIKYLEDKELYLLQETVKYTAYFANDERNR